MAMTSFSDLKLATLAVLLLTTVLASESTRVVKLIRQAPGDIIINVEMVSNNEKGVTVVTTQEGDETPAKQGVGEPNICTPAGGFCNPKLPTCCPGLYCYAPRVICVRRHSEE